MEEFTTTAPEAQGGLPVKCHSPAAATEHQRTEIGKPVYFADEDLTVYLDVVDYPGTPRSTNDCPISRACRRLYGCHTAEIGRGSSYLEFPRFFIRYRTKGLAKLVTEAVDYEVLRARGGAVHLGAVPPSGRKPRIPGKVGGTGAGNPATVRIDDPFLRRRLA